MNVKLHEAEHCMNELAACKAPWYASPRFDIIVKWMEAFHQRKLKEINDTRIS
jgi:hypothetical protein